MLSSHIIYQYIFGGVLMNSRLFRATDRKDFDLSKEMEKKIDEKIDVFMKVKKNKDNLCSSLFEIENFLCQVKKVGKLSHLYKFLK